MVREKETGKKIIWSLFCIISEMGSREFENKATQEIGGIMWNKRNKILSTLLEFCYMCLYTHTQRLQMSKQMLSYTQNNHIRFSQAVRGCHVFATSCKRACISHRPVSPLALSSWYAFRLIWKQSDQMSLSHSLLIVIQVFVSVIYSMFGPILTLQFYSSTWREGIKL